MKVRGVWSFVGMDPPENVAIKVNPVFVAYEFAREEQSKLAWEKAMKASSNISIWRMAKPDYSAWQIVAMGETASRLKKADLIFQKHGGKFWTPEIGMVRALALRRYNLAVEEAKKGNVENVMTQNRWGKDHPMQLNQEGEMHPYKKPDA